MTMSVSRKRASLRARRIAVAAFATSALCVGSLVAGAPVASAQPRHTAVTPRAAGFHRASRPRTLSCPTTGGIPFTGSLSNGAVTLGRAVAGSGLSGSFCGILALKNGGVTVSIPQSDFAFNPSSVQVLGFLSLPTTITADGPATGKVTQATGGGYNVTMSVPVTATVSALGFSCAVGPFTPVLTTGKSGSVSGSPLIGKLTSLKGALAAGEFTVPQVQESPSCPGFIAGLVNLLTGLPLPSGASTLTASTSLAAA
jgi:hypothetical protein